MSSVLKDQVNIGTLKTGDSFGEVALSSDDFRTASIFCTQSN
jgi:hypothetical protein